MMDKKVLEAYNKLVLDINSLQKDKDNPYFKSKYVDLNQILDEVKKKVQEAGFCMPQTVRNGVLDGVVQTYLHTELIWIESGEVFLSCDLPLVGMSDMQKLGSAITYARRYSLLPMLQLQCEDDDGNEASGLVQQKKGGYDSLKTVEEFKEAISNAKSRNQLGALYHKWSEIYAKGSAEYTEINKFSSNKRKELEANEGVKVVNSVNEIPDSWGEIPDSWGE